MDAWHVYVLRTRDGSLYTGITTDVERRLADHDGSPRGAKSLRGRGPLELVYALEVGDRALASRVEVLLKGCSKAEKEAIVAEAPGRRGLLRRLGA